MTDSVATLVGRSIGAMILAFFGAAWMAVGLLQSRIASPIAVGIVVACALLIAGVALAQLRCRPRGGKAGSFDMRLYGIINAVQWMMIFVTAAVLPAIGYRDWVVPVSIAIVGLHFLPLARSFGEKLYYGTGSALVLLAVTYPFVPGAGPKSSAGLFGAGVILWVTAAVALAANSAFDPKPRRGSAECEC